MKIRQKILVTLSAVLALVGCSQADLLNATITRQGYSVQKDIAYGDDARQKLDIYIPAHAAPGNPVIVFYYGGSWQMGSKKDYLFAGQAFASRGYTVVIADYRLYPQVYFPAFMEDAASAYVWTHRNIASYGGNPDHMFVAGHSAGAYNAIMLTLNEHYIKVAGGKPDWIKGAVGLAGPYDFLPFIDPEIIALFSKVDGPLTQPITYARLNTPPMLLLIGDKDTDVLPRNSINLTARLQSMGDDVTLKTYAGLDHIDMALALAEGFRDKAPELDDIDSFIKSKLR